MFRFPPECEPSEGRPLYLSLQFLSQGGQNESTDGEKWGDAPGSNQRKGWALSLQEWLGPGPTYPLMPTVSFRTKETFLGGGGGLSCLTGTGFGSGSGSGSGSGWGSGPSSTLGSGGGGALATVGEGGDNELHHHGGSE